MHKPIDEKREKKYEHDKRYTDYKVGHITLALSINEIDNSVYSFSLSHSPHVSSLPKLHHCNRHLSVNFHILQAPPDSTFS